MTLDYDNEQPIKGLEPVMDEYTDWFMQVVRRLFFALDKQEGTIFADPKSFSNWVKGARDQNDIGGETLDGLTRLHDDLRNMANQLIGETVELQRSPVYKDFDQLAMFFEEFIHALRRIASEHKSGDNALDPLTGLRRADRFYKDIQREMDRLARQGKAFSIALVRIDHLPELQKSLSAQDFESCLKLVAAMVKKTIRSFDDAYRMEDNQFLLSLKQTSSSGGRKALQRLKAELEKQDAVYKVSGRQMPLSLSSCIAEPLPEDDIRQILNNMNADLDEHQKQGEGQVIEYLEISPLQRFIKEGQD